MLQIGLNMECRVIWFTIIKLNLKNPRSLEIKTNKQKQNKTKNNVVKLTKYMLFKQSSL